MFPLGHLGIGSKLVSPFSRGLPRRYLLLGTLLPDLIDKPLYYLLVLITGLRGAELGDRLLISGSRTIGHTTIVLLLLIAAAAWRRSRPLAAVCLGMITHLLLDAVWDHFGPHRDPANGAIVAILFPLFGARFPVAPFHDLGEHLGGLRQPAILAAEVVGLLILLWDYWTSAHMAEFRTAVAARRARRKLRRRLRRQN
jgi:hypothetical protein